MNAHVLQHVPFEDIGSITSWLEARRATVAYTRFFDNPTLPPLDGLELIIVMGGPMSVNDVALFPWLRPEKDFIRKAIEMGIPILGICLGAQLIASALGSQIYQNREKEIGWFFIDATDNVPNIFSLSEKYMVFHWHGETFDLPVGAIRLARSAACENQAFQVGQRVIGLQFHLESTPDSVREMIDNCSNELLPGRYVQTEVQLQEGARSFYADNNALMEKILSFITRPQTGAVFPAMSTS